MKHEFKHENIMVTWDDEVCIHAGNCVRTLPSAFDVNRDPWINPGDASRADLAETIRACPSGALELIDTADA